MLDGLSLSLEVMILHTHTIHGIQCHLLFYQHRSNKFYGHYNTLKKKKKKNKSLGKIITFYKLYLV